MMQVYSREQSRGSDLQTAWTLSSYVGSVNANGIDEGGSKLPRGVFQGVVRLQRLSVDGVHSRVPPGLTDRPGFRPCLVAGCAYARGVDWARRGWWTGGIRATKMNHGGPKTVAREMMMGSKPSDRPAIKILCDCHYCQTLSDGVTLLSRPEPFNFLRYPISTVPIQHGQIQSRAQSYVRTDRPTFPFLPALPIKFHLAASCILPESRQETDVLPLITRTTTRTIRYQMSDGSHWLDASCGNRLQMRWRRGSCFISA